VVGDVIGINAFIFTGSDNNRGSIGIGFAIPVERAKRVAHELLTYGKRRMIFTGISVQDLTRPVALALKSDQSSGVVVSDISRGSPGDAGKLMRGDIIVQMGNRSIYTSKDIGGLFLDYFVGDSVSVTYIRKGKKSTTTIVLAEYR
jgi:S1-C subfamily serine protease